MRRIVVPIDTPDHAPEVAIGKLAARQHGIISRSQLLELGHTPETIKHRLRIGRLHRIHTGVYAVGHTAFLQGAHYMAAVLAVGDGAVLSHKAAAARLGLRSPPSGPVDVTVPGDGGRRYQGLAVHVTRSLPDSEVTKVENIPCTTWARTLVDLAAVVNARQLGRALERTLELRIFDRRALDAVMERSNGRSGVRLLRDLVTDLTEEAPPLASELERLTLEIIGGGGFPDPVINGYIGELQVDFHWPDYKLVVETDGAATHAHAIAFHRDRERDLYLQERGWRVIRLSWRQVVYEPQRVVALLGGLFAELGFGGAGLGGRALA